jgi:hypothetical protein
MAARDEAVSYNQMQDGGALDELAPCPGYRNRIPAATFELIDVFDLF